MFYPHDIAEAGYRRDAMLADAENHRLAKQARAARRRVPLRLTRWRPGVLPAAPAAPVRPPETARNSDADGRCPVPR